MSSATNRPLLILSDLHLAPGGPEAPANDLAQLLRRHPDHELVLAGDIFDLSIDPPTLDPAESVAKLLRGYSDLAAALREHLSRGTPVTFVAGNHDAQAASPRAREAVLAALGVQGAAPFETSSWFVRRGGTHVEHGHLYDPDNAPSHPLALWSYSTEPLGVALTRRFLAPCQALQFAHAHETTPLKGLARAFRLYGVRTPWVIARYFATAITLCVQAGRSPELERELAEGREAIEDFARALGLDVEVVKELAQVGPRPTHHRFTDTFMRLYFDRIVAALTLTSGAALGVAGSVTGLGTAALAAAYLSASVTRGGSRYSGLPEQRLRDAAHHIGESTGAQLVVFGHTHREDEDRGYMNSGSFVYSRRDGRPYIRVGEDGAAERCCLAVSA